jgi:DNA polymerase-3 subunit beta
MKVVLNRKELSDALDLTSNVVSKKSINPILQNILLSAKEGELEITATDLEVSILIRMGAEIETEGEITVMNSLLRDIIKSAKSENIEIASEGPNNIAVRAPGTSYHAMVHTIQSDEFPTINRDELDNAPSFFIKGFLLREMINKNIPFAAKDDVRYTFNSVFFEKDNLEFRTVSSDTKRLSLAKTFIDSSVADFSLLIPIKTAKILKT